MKKSKIIIPALSMIAFSVAASVAGAVAWFTASRSASITAGSYSVVKTSAELTATLDDGIGTEVIGANEDTIQFNGYLTDGSFSHKGNFITVPDAAGKAMKETVDLADATETNMERGTNAADNKTIYTAATFDLTFTIKFGATGENVGLFIDNGAGKTNFTLNGTGTPVTAKGFRMAIVPKTVTYESDTTTPKVFSKVIADLQTFDKCSYVKEKSDSDISGEPYVSTDYDLIDSAYSTAVPADGALTKAQARNRADYLGYFTFSAGATVELEYTVVAWFEGTDENIVNQPTSDLYQQVNSTLCFEAVNLKADS